MAVEEWQFILVAGLAGIICGAIILEDIFSINRFWVRRTRLKNPPSPKKLVEAHNRHHQFYYRTYQRLFDTTYISFFLFVLSYWGTVVMAGGIVLKKMFTDAAIGEIVYPFFWILVLFFTSRWLYRQKQHHTTAHKLIGVLCCFLLVECVHVITGLDYVYILFPLVVIWIWVITSMRVIVGFKMSYAEVMATNILIPVIVLVFLITGNYGVVFLIFVPGLLLSYRESHSESGMEFPVIKKLFPHSFPFWPLKIDSLYKDMDLSFNPRIFTACSFFEVLYWGLMTPIVLIPLTIFMHDKEEQLKKWRHNIITWSQTEHVLDPETVADRLGLRLEDTYPLLNELVDTGELTLFKGRTGLKYGVTASSEVDTFIEKLNLQKIDLPPDERTLLEYMAAKNKFVPPKTVLVSVMENQDSTEVSVEPAGGTVSALKSIMTVDSSCIKNVSQELYYIVREITKSAEFFRKNTMGSSKTLNQLEQKGKDLLQCIFPQFEEIDMSHIVLDTNMNIPFELLFGDQAFALKYSIGRKLRITGSIKDATNREIWLEMEPNSEKIRALVIADVDSNFRGVIPECDLIYKNLSKLIDVDYMKKKEMTFPDILERLLKGYTIIHYAGHLTDSGFPFPQKGLSMDMIGKSLPGSPIVFINGCKSAGVVHTGLTQAFLKGGALGYVGTPFIIHDTAAADIAISFYRNCLDHYSIGEALRMAKEKAYKENNIAWACFVFYGDPTLSLI
ncbi:MAG: CHAT domain-containing protein [Candidatus Methanofastidiosia archaeon]|jgi:hypothetical protein